MILNPIKRKSCAADAIKSISSKNVLRALQSISSMYVIWAIYDTFASQVDFGHLFYRKRIRVNLLEREGGLLEGIWF